MNYKGFYCDPQYFESDKMYHGFIDKIPRAEEIVAPNIDDFIRLYHQTVDDYLDNRKAPRSRSLIIWTLIAAFFIIAAFTCPDKAKHLEVLSDRAGYAISKRANDEGGFVALLGLAGNNIAKLFLQNSLVVDNYFFFSIGKIEGSDGTNVVSVGAFGHVFTSSGEEMYKRMQEQFED